jgi:hypothetical protein
MIAQIGTELQGLSRAASFAFSLQGCFFAHPKVAGLRVHLMELLHQLLFDPFPFMSIEEKCRQGPDGAANEGANHEFA